ncbi:ABC-type Na+ efflux pump permease component- like protein [Xylanimonas cellulosilytica DSM 15894]|uniref:ABC-type Na+ efflux pump permease component-like protein n=1 Tax=Xylanimonas cellulosilytica (strain DSM 15894 / JCM 12276 / CECT 5975 / KCTC 9989 / LMG 20990 / NBRC 107835 / XIL07) TaxID=446471 RepID=D1BXT5_XYLCX|nr:ABC transporter permease [Xylanimonas cellulosilytica]ACZ31726.1 ABC-type Na+ efflux pump permease component- like protein [Xylanimonas cellulosilytica DSM 15894]
MTTHGATRTTATASTPANAPQTLNPFRAIWLIAQREITTRVRQRSFLITTALLVAAVVAGILLVNATSGSSGFTLGATDGGEVALEQAVDAAGLDVTVQAVSGGDTESLLRDGGFDAIVSPGEDGVLTVQVEQTLPPELAPVLHGLAQQQALAAQVADLGGDPAEVAAAIGAAHAEVVPLDPPEERDVTQVIAGYLVGILMFMALMISSQMVAQGVVEEKTSRVVELLLATVRPAQLMAGKVLGIGLIGLLQVGLTVGAAAGTASATGLLDASGLRVGSTLVWALVWFLVGFGTYALVLAALAALVSRQEEVASVTTPATMFMILPYLLGVSVLPWDPTNQLASTLSFVPGFAPFLMPMREALGVAPLWQSLVALLLSLAVIPVLVWIAGKIYGNAVLRTGARIKLKDALRAS